MWLIAASGGTAVPLTSEAGFETPGSWSPDGAWFVYQRFLQGKVDLMKVKTSGEAKPVVLKANINPSNEGVPLWSPAGDWIAYNDRGEKLISPDGAKTRDLGDHHYVATGLSADGKTPVWNS